MIDNCLLGRYMKEKLTHKHCLPWDSFFFSLETTTHLHRNTQNAQKHILSHICTLTHLESVPSQTFFFFCTTAFDL